MPDAKENQIEQTALEGVRLRMASGDPIAAFVIIRNLLREGTALTDKRWLDFWTGMRARVRDAINPREYSQIEEAILKAHPTDDELFDLRLSENQRVAVILGAGASVPEPSALPTVAHLLPELWNRAAKLGRDDLRKLEDWCRTNGISNIEDLLTAAYIANSAGKNSAVLSLLEFFLYQTRQRPDEETVTRRAPASSLDAAGVALFQDTLQTLFALLLGRMIAAQPNAAHKAIAALASTTSRVSVVTTNYDGCIDQAFVEQGIGCNYFLENTPESVGPSLVKMHGSINWAYCDSCQQMHVADLQQMRMAYDQDTLGFPVIAICKGCGGQRRPMIVPPMSFKFVQFPPLLVLWDKARTVLNEADIIVAVGYSFSEADTYITKMTLRAMAQNPHRRLVVIDPSLQLSATLSRQLGAVIDGFDKSRVIRSRQSCELILPAFFESYSRHRSLKQALMAPRRPWPNLSRDCRPPFRRGVASQFAPYQPTFSSARPRIVIWSL